MLTQKELRQLFDLNFETGELIWKKPPVHLAGKLERKYIVVSSECQFVGGLVAS